MIKVETENSEKIKFEIKELKISDKLNNKNPFKNLIYNLENNIKSGLIYKIICLLFIVYIFIVNILAILQHNQYAFTMIPISLWGLIVLFLCACNVFYKKNISYKIIINLIFILYEIILICTIFTVNLNLDGNVANSFLNDLLPIKSPLSQNIYINYSIIIGSVCLFLVTLNNIWIIYENKIRLKLIFNFSIFSRILFFLFSMFCIIIAMKLAYKEIFISNNVFKISIFMLGISTFFAYLLILLNIYMLKVIRKFSLFINKIYY